MFSILGYVYDITSSSYKTNIITQVILPHLAQLVLKIELKLGSLMPVLTSCVGLHTSVGRVFTFIKNLSSFTSKN